MGWIGWRGEEERGNSDKEESKVSISLSSPMLLKSLRVFYTATAREASDALSLSLFPMGAISPHPFLESPEKKMLSTHVGQQTGGIALVLLSNLSNRRLRRSTSKLGRRGERVDGSGSSSVWNERAAVKQRASEAGRGRRGGRKIKKGENVSISSLGSSSRFLGRF